MSHIVVPVKTFSPSNHKGTMENVYFCISFYNKVFSRVRPFLSVCIMCLIAVSGMAWSLPESYSLTTKNRDSLLPAGVQRNVQTKDSIMTVDSLQTLTLSDKALTDTLSVDTLAADSTHKGGLDFPVAYEASDSMTYEADTRLSTLFGQSKVTYQDMQLEAAVISMNNDSSLAHAIGVRDSLGELTGTPVYTQNSDSYESEEMTYNFKTKKGFIKNVSTAQGDGFLNSQMSKRSDDGTLFLQHAKYTTCDHDPPHFYLALSRAKVKPGKQAIFGPAYLVVADVPLPLAVPSGFFPFTSSYSSGFIMPSYGSETARGFYL